MEAVYAVVRAAFSQAISAAFPALEHQPIITASRFGDFQCNSAPSLFKSNGVALGVSSPKDVADKIKAHLSASIFSKAEAAPQGFITVELSPTWISGRLHQILANPISIKDTKRLKVAVDFSSPNVAKEMHVGHLRSTIIGDSLCRILEFVGYSVERLNHIGDWGTQFGMLIEFIRQQNPDCELVTPPIGDLQKLYRAAKQRFDEDEDFKARSREAVVALQRGDESTLQLWRAICNVSRVEFQKVYDRLGIHLEERGESFYNPMLPGVIKELREKSLLKDSDGATCLFTSISPVPLMVAKSDGGYGYDSTDLAAIRHRLVDEQCDWLIYVTDIGQEEHFFKIFEAARLAGWHRPTETRCSHAGFGVVQGTDGKKFKTRSGELIRLADLLDEAASRAAEELSMRAAKDNDVEDQGYRAEIPSQAAAELMGYSAVKYFDLKQNRLTDYRFSFDRMLDPKGNTAVYLLYAYARICAIFRKAGISANTLNPAALRITEPSERKLCLSLIQLPDVILGVLEDLMIHRLAEYLYKTSCLFSDFYTNCKILDTDHETQESRLLLCEATRKVLGTGFQLLGVSALDRI